METREDLEAKENLALLSALPLDYSPSEGKVKSLPNDFMQDAQEEIKHRTGKMTLFAQTSSFWRSYYYLQQLQDMVLMGLENEQERLLTDLIINYELLLKDEAQDNLSRLLIYLEKYYLNLEIPIHNRLLAQALSLMINKNATPRQHIEFEFALKTYCYSSVHFPRHQLYHSLIILVKTARGITVDLPMPDVKDILHLGHNVIESVYEAQLILAPFAKQYLADAKLISQIAKGYVDMGYRNTRLLNYIYLLHAAIKMLPQTSDDLICLINQLPSQEDYLFAITGLIETLISREKNLNQAYILEHRLKLSLGISMTYAKNMRAMQARVTDVAHMERLQVLIENPIFDVNSYHFANRACALLALSNAREDTLHQLLQIIYQKMSQGKRQEKFLSLIAALFAKLQSITTKVAVAKQLLECYLTNPTCFSLTKAAFIFDYLPQETYQSHIENEYLKLKCLQRQDAPELLLTFCKTIKCEKQITYWLNKFQLLIDSMPEDFYKDSGAWKDISYCYNYLLAKKRDPELLQAWQLQLQRLDQIDGWWSFHKSRMVMEILPYLNDDAIAQWMVRINIYRNEVLTKEFITCLSQLYSKLSPEKQIEYWQIAMESLFHNHLNQTPQVLNALPNLLRQIPDELLLELNPDVTVAPAKFGM